MLARLRSSARYFQAWVAGYRAIRTFSTADEAAVAAFGILGDLRVTAWKLGLLLRLAALLCWTSKTCRLSLRASSTGKLPI
jgi:hypothetical protein